MRLDPASWRTDHSLWFSRTTSWSIVISMSDADLRLLQCHLIFHDQPLFGNSGHWEYYLGWSRWPFLVLKLSFSPISVWPYAWVVLQLCMWEPIDGDLSPTLITILWAPLSTVFSVSCTFSRSCMFSPHIFHWFKKGERFIWSEAKPYFSDLKHVCALPEISGW